MTIAVHVTHEALSKIGGIGAVIEGLLTSKAHKARFKETLLYTPMFTKDEPAKSRLGPESELLYSGLDGVREISNAADLEKIEKKFGVKIAYGKKKICSELDKKKKLVVDIVAVDISHMPQATSDAFKFKLWETFGLHSDSFQHDFDYEQYLRIGAVVVEIFEVLYGRDARAVVFSHEYMGMPSALAFLMARMGGKRADDRLVFYAHEVSTCRHVVESHPGHDLSFYNLLRHDSDRGASLEERFGSFKNFSRNELVKLASKLDRVLAVGDIVKEEYLYLCPDADASKISVVPNGISFTEVDFKKKTEGISKLADYCENLYAFTPDHIFTHVTRLVISKGLWRDIRVLMYIDEHFAATGKKGFYLLLSSLIGSGRSAADACKMEDEYGWPVLHREGWPDLVGAEMDVCKQLEIFNAKSRSIKGVFINQFGFGAGVCGKRPPAGAEVLDVRLASDLEFGLSVYEPFGIAQLETFPYGGLPMVSSVCGCVSLLRKAAREDQYIEMDFTRVPHRFVRDFGSDLDYMNLSATLRDSIETDICKIAAGEAVNRLPKTNRERIKRFNEMSENAKAMNWEFVSKDVIAAIDR
jgi:hypothetical protein